MKRFPRFSLPRFRLNLGLASKSFGSLFGWRRRGAAPGVVESELAAARAELPRISKILEGSFLGASHGLEKLVTLGDRFVSESDLLVNAAIGRNKGGELFFDALKVVEAPLEFLQQSHSEIRSILLRLKKDNDRIAELITVQSDLERIIAPLTYIQILMKIESAPLGIEVQQMFGSLSKEIDRLHYQVCDLFATKFRELREIQRGVNLVMAELQAQTERLGEGIAREKATIDQALQQMQRELIANQTRQSHIGRLGAALKREIQQIVVGLQFQDLIHQKLQHSSAGLGQIQARLADAASSSFLVQACRLQSEQLRAVRKDVAQAESVVKTGVEKLLGLIVNAESQCLSLKEFQQLTTSADGMVQVLLDVFATLQEQIAATVAGSAKAFDQLRPVGGLASDLTAIVRDISQSIHLIGLNAQVQAARVVDGVGLEVLSARTTEISGVTNRISEQVARQLDELIKALAEGVKALEGLNGAAQRQQSSLKETGATCERNLHELRDDVLAMLGNVDELLKQIQSEARVLIQGVDYVAAADEPLGKVENQLRAMAQPASGVREPGAGEAHADLRQLREGYTMASERHVFTAVVGGRKPAAAADETSRVELFDDPEIGGADHDEPTRAAGPTRPERAAAGNVQALAEKRVVAPIADPKPHELGANVELF